MTACCSDPDCRRSEPFMLYLSDFSDTVYLATRSRHVRGSTYTAVSRHDITAGMQEFIRRNPEWVNEQLRDVS